MTWALVVLLWLTVLVTAALALGSYVVVQGAGRLAHLLWFGFLTALLLATLGAGALSLVLLLLQAAVP